MTCRRGAREDTRRTRSQTVSSRIFARVCHDFCELREEESIDSARFGSCPPGLGARERCFAGSRSCDGDKPSHIPDSRLELG